MRKILFVILVLIGTMGLATDLNELELPTNYTLAPYASVELTKSGVDGYGGVIFEYEPIKPLVINISAAVSPKLDLVNLGMKDVKVDAGIGARISFWEFSGTALAKCSVVFDLESSTTSVYFTPELNGRLFDLNIYGGVKIQNLNFDEIKNNWYIGIYYTN